ncbi:hypothetical protein BGZ47_009867 [Haplosporangium gracile]|nr:hypothetical protein BGZ47_009867 [Haplosporangium gracile]
MASSASSTTVASAMLKSARDHEYFETGVNHVLCKVPGLDQSSFPTEFQDTWDLEHVRMPCSKRIYESDKSFWPEISKRLSEPIVNCQQLSDVMLQWNKGKQNGWNLNALDAFLNIRSADLPQEGSGAHSDTLLDPTEQQIQAARAAGSSSDDDDYDFGRSSPHQEDVYNQEQVHPFQQPGGNASAGTETETGGPLKSQFLSTKERQYFFDVTLPRMQALALRLPELITKPIPFLKQQQDSAVTLSQEQIACLLANFFFNTFPCRNAPYKRGRKKKSAVSKEDSIAPNVKQGSKGAAEEEDDSGSEDKDERPPSKGHRQANNKGEGARGGGGGGVRGAGRGGKKGQGIPRPPRKQRSKGPAAKFEFFEDESPSSVSTKLEDLAMKDEEVKEGKDWMPKMPSINFISLFWTEESRTPCTPAQAAKLRCILHYFDRVTTEMPRGTVTYHRQVLKKPAYLTDNERWKKDDFTLSNVAVDWSIPLEEAPQGALQLDFANKNIGGGALEKGAVQEEIRFMICPELIVSRLFCQQLEANEAVLIKGVERYSNYIGYSKTFEWFSDHRDPTPRDKLGRRMTEVCAIDARPFKSRLSRLDQFERHYVLREINKAIVGFRQSPINASEWGLARPDDDSTETSSSADKKRFRPIATGNWGCGAFGGHLQLKFVLQWIAASICGGFSPDDKSLGDDLLYYTFGMQQLQEEIEAFVKVANASGNANDPKRLVECIMRYPRRNSVGEIQGFREKTLLEYLSTAMTFVPEA